MIKKTKIIFVIILNLFLFLNIFYVKISIQRFNFWDREVVSRRIKTVITPDTLLQGLNPPGIEPKRPYTITFDIGGATTRVGVYSPEGKLMETVRYPTPNYITHPGAKPEQLQLLILEQTISSIKQLHSKYLDLKLSNVGIAFAGLVDSKGVVLSAAVTWGDKSFPLKEELEKRLNVNSIVVNDITAAAFRYGFAPGYQQYRRIGVITVSSGVGSKIFDTKYKEVLLDDDGLAGEIGHIKVDFEEDAPACADNPEHKGHLSAVASGRGAEWYAKKLAKENPALFQLSIVYELAEGNPEKISAYHIAEAAKKDDAFALAVLDRITLPLAKIISIIATSTGIDKFIIIGGFALGVGEPYIRKLRENLVKVGIYGKSRTQIENLVELGINDDDSGLIGAGIIAQEHYLGKVYVKESKDSLGNPAFEVSTPREVNYKVISVKGVLDSKNNTLANYLRGRKVLVAVSETVYSLYKDRIEQYFSHQELDYKIITLKGGEENKNIEAVLEVVHKAEELGMDRRAVFVAIGGGIPMDIVGFAARIFRRGVDYIRIPTTLLGIVDAGVGIKVGVNFEGHKNFIGAFYPPLVVLNDCNRNIIMSPFCKVEMSG